jgi:hypothetical protein
MSTPGEVDGNLRIQKQKHDAAQEAAAQLVLAPESVSATTAQLYRFLADWLEAACKTLASLDDWWKMHDTKRIELPMAVRCLGVVNNLQAQMLDLVTGRGAALRDDPVLQNFVTDYEGSRKRATRVLGPMVRQLKEHQRKAYAGSTNPNEWADIEERWFDATVSAFDEISSVYDAIAGLAGIAREQATKG